MIAAALVVLAALVLAVARRIMRRRGTTHGPTMRAELDLLRQLPASIVGAALLLGAVQVVARIAMLPVLMATGASPPPARVSTLGSFAMLYGQLVSPTPSGAGVVDYLGVHGVAGGLGRNAAWVLGWWRVYSTLGGAVFGLPLLGRLVRTRRGRGPRGAAGARP